MKTFFLILSLCFSTLYADKVTIYDLGTGSLINLVASYEYSPPIKSPFDMFDVVKSQNNIYLQRDDQEKTVLLYKNKKMSFPQVKDECCNLVVSDHSDELYFIEKIEKEKNIVIFDPKSEKIKQKIKVPYGDNLTISPDGWVYLQHHDFSNDPKAKKTIIYRKKLSKFDNEWEKILEENQLLYIYCTPADSSFSLIGETSSDQHLTKFYNVDKDQHLTYLGEINLSKTPIGKYVTYHNQPQPIFFKDKKIYTFQGGKLTVDKDFTNSQFKNITVEQNNIYGILY